MKQVFLRKGSILIEDVPAPARQPNNILVEITHSVISTGTELSTIKNSGALRPERAAKAWESLKVRGITRTMDLIKEKMESLEPLGYSCAGKVIAVGANVLKFKIGDRVACGGAGWANHAEIVSVPENLAAPVPDEVPDRLAAYTTIGAIALQGVRRADVRLGETVCVIGLGLIGQLTVQLLEAAGCTVIGLDTDLTRTGANGVTTTSELIKRVQHVTGGHGVDATLLTASTASSDPVNLAFDVTRKKGRIVVVGAVGMELKRSPFYEKEQDFLISCSYGPGRYDPDYEVKGNDYPYAYVRWTENRNMRGFLDLVARQQINVEPLIGIEVPLARAAEAYDQLANGAKPLSVLLTSAPDKAAQSRVIIQSPPVPPIHGRAKIALIGLGEFVRSTHIPNLKRLSESVEIYGVCSQRGDVAAAASKRLKATITTTEPQELLKNPAVDAVMITTRHHLHAQMAEEALKAGKHVFLEKPLALTEAEVDSLEKTMSGLRQTPVFIVGFNRRFAPLITTLKERINGRKSPLVATYRVNAAPLPSGHWGKTDQGGGRLRGEACHMIDLFRHLTGSPLKEMTLHPVNGADSNLIRPDENFSADFVYEDGSLCHLVYTTLGHSQLAKEYLEVHADGQSYVLDDFTSLGMYDAKVQEIDGRQDKGHTEILHTFFDAIKKGRSFPIPWDELKETTLAAVQLHNAAWGILPE